MEKLIKLLNEYNEGGHWRDENFDANKLLVISKEYGFIKWLVENNKIELPLAKYDLEDYTEYEKALMCLAIQDEPIEFLVSILK